MKKATFDKLSNEYAPLIKRLIEANTFYTGIDTKIQWMFAWDDSPAITAAVNRETNIMSINVVFVD